jgi:DNA-binding PadR family transcriptional regulator
MVFMEEKLNELVSDFSRFYLLTILYEGPEHGYSILRKFNNRIGKKISLSLDFIYPFLQQLEEKKLISVKSQMIGNKEKKFYNLTEEGRAFCNRLFNRFANVFTFTIESSRMRVGQFQLKDGYERWVDLIQ